MKSEVLRSRGATVTKLGLNNRARKAVLKALLDLTEADADNFAYFNRVRISRGVPEVRSDYGFIETTEVPDLLEPYISQGIVQVARIKHNTGQGIHVGYRANLEKRDAIQTELKREY